MELANIYAQFGSEVTILNRNDRLAPADDAETGEALADILTDNGVAIEWETELARVDAPVDEPLTLTLETARESRTMDVDALLISIGRTPNIEGLDLAAGGVEVEEGAIKVDDLLRTTTQKV